MNFTIFIVERMIYLSNSGLQPELFSIDPSNQLFRLRNPQCFRKYPTVHVKYGYVKLNSHNHGLGTLQAGSLQG